MSKQKNRALTRTHLMISVSTDSRSLGPPEERTDCGTGGKPRLLLAEEEEDAPPNVGRDGGARAPPGWNGLSAEIGPPAAAPACCC